jgi:aryl-alcohol dehydrogenase-like predicted oxidoreductase
MEYRALGKTGLRVSEIGFGTWQLADDPGCWVGADLKESMDCLYKFVEARGNFIDTAWVYGWSKEEPYRHASEELIGRFLAESGKRDKLILATKVPPKNHRWPASRTVPISELFPNEHIERCVDDSLGSLGVDSIDLVQFHVWDDSFAKEEGWKETVQKLSDEGKVKNWGISVNDYEPENCLETLDTGLIATVQFIFNIFHQRPIERLLPYARKHRIGMIARVPLDEGGLSGKFTKNTRFRGGDFRKTYFEGERLAELVERTEKMKGLLGTEALTLPELALRFVLSFGEVSTTIPGMRKLEHVKSNVSVADGRRLSTEMLHKLEKHAWERNFYSF